MNKPTMLFCRAVLLLEYVPAYRRLYVLSKDAETGRWTTKNAAAHWRYMRRGLWGIHLLDRMGLFWPYLDATNTEWLPETPFPQDDEDEQ